MTVTVIKRTCLDNVRYLSVKLFFLSLVLCVIRHSSLRRGGGSARGDRYVQPSWDAATTERWGAVVACTVQTLALKHSSSTGAPSRRGM